MKTFAKVSLIATAALAASVAMADVKFDANIEYDLTKVSGSGKNATDGGRVEVNANANLGKSADYFVNAKGTAVLGVSSTSDVTIDDAWLHLGNSAVDLKMGRFEAADLFPMGQDTIVEKAADIGYNANSLRGRNKDDRIHAVVGANLGGARVELGLTSKDGTTKMGIRPTVAFNAGPLALRAGIEKTSGSTTGFGLGAGYSFKGIDLNANFAKKDSAKSFGLNGTMGAAGLGYVLDKNGSAKTNTVYASYKLPLFGIKGASMTPAASFSKATGTDSVTGLRLRFNYAF